MSTSVTIDFSSSSMDEISQETAMTVIPINNKVFDTTLFIIRKFKGLKPLNYLILCRLIQVEEVLINSVCLKRDCNIHRGPDITLQEILKKTKDFIVKKITMNLKENSRYNLQHFCKERNIQLQKPVVYGCFL